MIKTVICERCGATMKQTDFSDDEPTWACEECLLEAYGYNDGIYFVEEEYSYNSIFPDD